MATTAAGTSTQQARTQQAATPASAAGSQERPPTPWGRLGVVGAGLVLLLSLMVMAFMWPAVSGSPRDIPLGVVAPPAQAEQIAAALDHAQPGAFDVRQYADAGAAQQAVREREVYGAVVLDADGGRMLTAPAASPAVATALGQVADALAAQQAQAQDIEIPDLLPVQPVVTLPADDPRGAGLPAAALPLVLASLATGVVASLTVRGTARRVVLVGAVAAVGGLAVGTIAGPWLGVLAGDFWAQSGVVALGVGSIALAVVGAYALVGRGGLAVVAATMILLGNPLSAAAAAPELLPAGWAELGQGLPPGAIVTALRSVAYFDGAGVGAPLTVLGAWLAAGALLLVGVMATRGRRSVRAAQTLPHGA